MALTPQEQAEFDKIVEQFKQDYKNRAPMVFYNRIVPHDEIEPEPEAEDPNDERMRTGTVDGGVGL